MNTQQHKGDTMTKDFDMARKTVNGPCFNMTGYFKCFKGGWCMNVSHRLIVSKNGHDLQSEIESSIQHLLKFEGDKVEFIGFGE